jgi:nucleoside-diphosphate kinase
MSNPNVETETTFVMLKPDALERNLVGEIIGRLERKGLRLKKIELTSVSKELAARHYAEHLEKAFYPELEAYVTRGPVLATIWEGRKAITVVRGLLGATDSTKAAAGTIRGDFGFDATENLVHASDSPESAEREIRNFFGE